METNGTINWIIGVGITNIIAFVGAGILWYKSLRMLPKEVKGADLSNQMTEVSLAQQLQNVAKNAAAQVLDYQEQLKCQAAEIEKLTNRIMEIEPLVKEVSQLRTDLERYRELNGILWQWNNLLQEQVRPYESPVTMPTTKKPKKEE